MPLRIVVEENIPLMSAIDGAALHL